MRNVNLTENQIDIQSKIKSAKTYDEIQRQFGRLCRREFEADSYSGVVFILGQSLTRTDRSLAYAAATSLGIVSSCTLYSRTLDASLREFVFDMVSEARELHIDDRVLRYQLDIVRCFLGDESILTELVPRDTLKPSEYRLLGFRGSEAVCAFLHNRFNEETNDFMRMCIAEAAGVAQCGWCISFVGMLLQKLLLENEPSGAEKRTKLAAMLCGMEDPLGIDTFIGHWEPSNLMPISTLYVLGQAFSNLDTLAVGESERVARHIRRLGK